MERSTKSANLYRYISDPTNTYKWDNSKQSKIKCAIEIYVYFLG